MTLLYIFAALPIWFISTAMLALLLEALWLLALLPILERVAFPSSTQPLPRAVAREVEL